ncbi:MAG: hypothetical protein IJQ84_05850 [Paludibacteraceae bacterium]|nr:hypothetical protein [Paludibacteraceae bacterium]MBQ6724018.1 hypothetical protein [Paludibacteraceae bacterium]
MELQELIEQTQHMECTYKVTEDVYKAFQVVSGDMNPLHTNVDFAKGKGFSECVMYGNILNCFLSHFVGMALPSDDVMIQTQDIQYHKPVFLNDEIKLIAEVEEYSEAVRIINYKLKFYRMNAEKPQLVAKGHVQIGLI